MYEYVQVSHTRHKLTQVLVLDCPHYTPLLTLPDIGSCQPALSQCQATILETLLAGGQRTRFQGRTKHMKRENLNPAFLYPVTIIEISICSRQHSFARQPT